MKIYKSDGSYLDNFNDDAFGWSLENSSVNPTHASLSHKDFQLLCWLKDEVTEDASLETKTVPNMLKIHKGIVSRENILNLIDPCTLEGKILFSILLQNIKYRNFVDCDNWFGFKNINHDTMNNKPNNLKLRLDQVRNGFLKRNLAKLLKNDEEICRIRMEISSLKKYFAMETSRVEKLVMEAKFLRIDFGEVTFLDNLICMMKGELDNVILTGCPFRIFLGSMGSVDYNLIV